MVNYKIKTMDKDATYKFSLKARWKSLGYAMEGITAFFVRQHNAIIHLFFTIGVFMAAIFFRVSANEMIALVLAIGFVWTAEIFNTVIESIMDYVSPNSHPKVKFIKDVSAAAVLVAALAAILVGLIIFVPKLI